MWKLRVYKYREAFTGGLHGGINKHNEKHKLGFKKLQKALHSLTYLIVVPEHGSAI